MEKLIEYWNNLPNWGIQMVIVAMAALYLLQIMIAFIMVVSGAISLFKEGSTNDKLISILFFPVVSIFFTPFIGSLFCAMMYDDEVKNEINPKLNKVITIYVVAWSAICLWGILLGVILGG